MKKLLRTLATIIIPLFCLWQIIAIAVYLIPSSATLPLMNKVITPIKTFTSSYVLITSQWQIWDIFSPNPLRRVSLHSIDTRLVDGRWQTIRPLDPQSIPWPIRVKELKILGRLEEDGWRNAVPSYLAARCTMEQLSDIDIRLHVVRYVIPLPAEVRAFGGWQNWQPQKEELDLGFTHCPYSARST
ncbi:MAG: hypothetical protein KBD00_00150 [Candidatus Peribacteraceae bacterium]|nr:hypothetical protein [Candidatus Peribacteraceae bacterium]